MLWILVRLRYRLIWALGRRRAGGATGLKAALLVAGGFGLLLLVGVSAISGPVVQSGDRAAAARWLLTGLLVNALALALATGRGVSAGLSASFLRRFPITRVRLFCARHVIGLLDPVWPLYAAALAGVIWRCARGGAGMAPARVLAGVTYLLFSYSFSTMAVLAVDRMLRRRSGTAVLYGVLLAAFTAAPLAVMAVESSPAGLLARAEPGLRFLPPGLAASVMADPGKPGLFGLLAWCVVAAAGLFGLERLPPPGSAMRMPSGWGWLSLKTCALSGPGVGPLLAKALLYHFRCDRVQLNSAVTVAMVVFLPVWMGRSGGADTVFALQVALFFLASAMATNIIVLNQFGFDGPGIERYLLLPVPYSSALRAGSLACLLVGGVVTCMSFAAWLVFSGPPVRGTAWAPVLSGVSGLFFFNAVGLWTSILAPRPVPFDGIMGAQLSWQGMVIQGGAIGAALGIAFVAASFPPGRGPSVGWWLPLSFAVAAVAAYLFSLALTSRIVSARRHELTCCIRTPE